MSDDIEDNILTTARFLGWVTGFNEHLGCNTVELPGVWQIVITVDGVYNMLMMEVEAEMARRGWAVDELRWTGDNGERHAEIGLQLDAHPYGTVAPYAFDPTNVLGRAGAFFKACAQAARGTKPEQPEEA